MMTNPFRPYGAKLRRLTGRAQPDFHAGAVESWEEAPGSVHRFYPSLALPGQVERIRASVFADMPATIEALTRDGDAAEAPTMGWRFRDVDLVDGVLYHRGAEFHLRPRRRKLGLAFRPKHAMRGAIYETWATNRWFGSWLMDALVASQLAAATGMAATTAPAPRPGSHTARYEELVGVQPARITGDVHFDEMVLFDDLGNNLTKGVRQRALRDRLLAGRALQPAPGVFLLRGTGGDLRLLQNEVELAERLARERGYLVIDPLKASADELIAACGAARAIVGVEGSHLAHGILVAPPGAAIVPIQPPERVAATLKQLSDRLNQRFGLLVAEGSDSQFTLEWRDLAATLDLFD